jgi:transposase
MSLKPKPVGPIPEDTLKLGQQLLSETDLMRQIGDKYANLVKDEDFASMYSVTGQPGLSPARLALVSVLQAMEHISDRQARAMVRTRIDWKYALHLPLSYGGFDASVLSEFRDRLVNNEAQRKIFDALLERLKAEGLLKGRGLQRSDSLLIVGAVRDLNRLELVMETLRLALTEIGRQDRQWLVANTPVEWIEKYGEWTQAERVVKEKGPKAKAETEALLLQTGRDGYELLEKLGSTKFIELEAVKMLELVWKQQYRQNQQAIEVHTPESREISGIEGKDLIASPHDPQVRYTEKREQKITGYKLQLTEVASEDAPAIITDIEVVASCAYDGASVEPIHARLNQRGLLPDEHLLDRGFVNGKTLTESRTRAVELIGPVGENTSFTARQAEGFSVENFQLDFEKRQAICPQGEPSQYWSNTIRKDGNQPIIRIIWNKEVCAQCPLRAKCTQAEKSGRVIKISSYYETIAERRKLQHSEEFYNLYRRRSGVEASLSQVVNHYDGRTTPYRGSNKTQLHYLTMAVGINLKRAINWSVGLRPKRQRISPLSKLMAVESNTNH